MRLSRLSPSLVSFWPLQLGGWALYTLATAVTLIPIGHLTADVYAVMVSIGVSFLASFVLRLVCRALWRRDWPLFQALAACAFASYVLGIGCAFATGATSMLGSGRPIDLHWGVALSEAASASVILEGWCALYFGIRHYLLATEQRTRLLSSEASAREAQLLALHYQLQPHFLFNTLNAISTLVVSNQPRQATEMITRLASLLRSTLDAPTTHTVTLRQELAVSEEYLAIERVRFGPRLQVGIEVSEDAAGAQVPRFVLQPLIENAIRHSIARLPEGGRIALSAYLANGALQIGISNDHRAASTTGAGARDGVGLANTRARLEQLYGVAASVTIVEEPQQFSVSLKIPYMREPISSPTAAT